MTSSRSALDVEDVRGRVSTELIALVERHQRLLPEISGDLAPMHLILADFLRRGKRLRPAFCWWAWRGAGGADCAAAMAAASSLELLQACALIHDDVLDGSDTRRGRPAVHKRFAALHADDEWRGDPDTFGVAGAILLGDLCLAWADEMFFRSGLDPAALLRAKPIFDITRTELMAGQYLDVLDQARATSSPQRTLTVARYKSAKYTIERPLHLGAALADAPPELFDAFSGYGLPLGEAFQLRDDVLGVFGDPEVTGKPAGDDLREGKRTFLIATATASATPEQSAVLAESIGDPDLTDSDIHRLREVIVETHALTQAETLIAARTEEALSALDKADITDAARSVLAELAMAATERSG